MLSSLETKSPPCFAHLGVFLELTKMSRKTYSGSLPPSPAAQAQLHRCENNSATLTQLWFATKDIKSHMNVLENSFQQKRFQ